MNDGFPPLELPPPQFYARRGEKPRKPPLPPELLARRGEIARILGVKVDSLNQALRSRSDDARKAMFYKLEHEQPVNLSGTGLKELTQPSKNVTLVVPRDDNLDKLKDKIEQFGTGALQMGRAPNEDLAHITEIAPDSARCDDTRRDSWPAPAHEHSPRPAPS